ncbi:MAG: hypothetical protein AAGF11_46310 [Myxococcota bacterium]
MRHVFVETNFIIEAMSNPYARFRATAHCPQEVDEIGTTDGDGSDE